MIRKLRADWTTRNGGRGGWRAFHDRFLSYGGHRGGRRGAAPMVAGRPLPRSAARRSTLPHRLRCARARPGHPRPQPRRRRVDQPCRPPRAASAGARRHRAAPRGRHGRPPGSGPPSTPICTRTHVRPNGPAAAAFGSTADGAPVESTEPRPARSVTNSVPAASTPGCSRWPGPGPGCPSATLRWTPK
jgi:hypothetical protein